MLCLIKMFILSFSLSAVAKDLSNSTPQLIKTGQKVYMNNCISCHGEKGDGHGVAARAISGAKPRDFTRGQFKYGEAPAELFKTITNGSPGTAMPPWNTLPEGDRWAVIHYVKSLKKK